MQANERIRQLLDLYQSGMINETELEELSIWLHGLTEEQRTELEVYFQPLWQKAMAGDLKVDVSVNWEAMKSSIFSNNTTMLEREVKVKRLWWKMAAAIILLLGLSFTWRILHEKPISPQPIAVNKIRTPDKILPGSNQTILTLDDGRSFKLDSTATGEILQEGDVKIVKLKNGEIAYSIAGNTNLVPRFHTVNVPRGGRPYQLQLADGSKIWLNAASSLRYPDLFDGGTRTVTLTGEGYFEVAHDPSRPFMVRTGNQLVEVLGTHFNINSYNDEDAVRTTLLEGSVKTSVVDPSTNTAIQSIIIKPGLQSVMDQSNGKLSLSEANTSLAVAWVKGYFQFDKTDVPAILRQVARWYDLDIEYAGKIPEDLFSGKMERNLSLAGIVNLLDRGNIHVKIEGRKLVVR